MDGLCRMAVPFFFTVSGYFLSAHFDEEGYWLREVQKRVRSLAVPYVLWNVIAFVLLVPVIAAADYVGHRSFGTNIPISGGRWVRAVGLDPTRMPFLVPLWYVRCLFLFVLLSPFFKAVVTRTRTIWLLFSFGVLLLYASGCFGNGDFFRYGYSLSGSFYFSLGIALRSLHVPFRASKWRGVMSSIMGIVLLVGKLEFANVGVNLLELAIPFLLYAVYCLIPDAEWPSWLTKTAFPIFLMHDIVIIYIESALSILGWSGVGAFIVVWCASVAIPIAVAAFVRSKSTLAEQVLFGGR